MEILTLILLVFALVCFAIHAAGVATPRVGLDAAGKAFLVGALIAYLY